MLYDFSSIIKWLGNLGATATIEITSQMQDPDTFELIPGASESHAIEGVVFPANSPLSTSTGIQFSPGGVFEADDYLLFVPSPVEDIMGYPLNLDIFQPNNDKVRVKWENKEFSIVKEWLDYEALGGYRAFVLRRAPERG